MNINKISKKQLVELKGIGETLAERIMKARPIRALEDLMEVKGFDTDVIELLKEQNVGVMEIDPKEKQFTKVNLLGTLRSDNDEKINGYVFNENNELIDRLNIGEEQQITLSSDVVGKNIKVFAGPDIELPGNPTAELLQKKGFAERNITVTELDPRIDFGDWVLPPRHFKMSCCQVKGKVLKRIVLPNGQTRSLPLCNARINICEVDVSTRLVIEKLEAPLVARMKMELIELGKPIAATIAEPLKLNNIAAVDATRFQALRAIPPTRELTTLSSKLQATIGIEAARATILDNLAVLKPHWCHLQWAFHRYKVDCIKTVDLDENGCFNTSISYPCFGDKPDLYFTVEQNCHPEGWKTVYKPSVVCSTIWDYCCGEEIEITVTHPDAAVGLTPGGCSFPFMAGDPASIGEWKTAGSSPVFVVHSAVMRSGKVLLFSGGVEAQLPLESRVWDPQTGNFTSQTFMDDLFCAHQVVLADGRVLVMGGSNYNGPHGRGIDASYTFDPIAETWTKHTDLNFGRWYPTAVMLSDGKALTFSGRSGTGSVVQQVERFDPGTNAWTTLANSANKALEIYPSMHLMNDGKIFYTGCRWAGNSRAWPSPPDTALFDPSSNSWVNVAAHVIKNRTEATSVLLPQARSMNMEGHEHGEELPPPPSTQRVLVLGGEADTPTNRKSAEIIDMNAGSPAWTRITDMKHRRVNPNAVILPDRKVLVVGGVSNYKFATNPGNILECEIFDPTTDSWSVAATMTRPRQYHSVSVLLPDGRVLASGTSSIVGNDFTMEIYSPPYLFRGPRPKISSAPSSAAYGSTITIKSPDSCRIKDVVLIRPGAPTHHTDSEQRLIPLHIHNINECDINVAIPLNKNWLPPGYYMLFIVDDCEVPSIAKFIRIN